MDTRGPSVWLKRRATNQARNLGPHSRPNFRACRSMQKKKHQRGCDPETGPTIWAHFLGRKPGPRILKILSTFVVNLFALAPKTPTFQRRAEANKRAEENPTAARMNNQGAPCCARFQLRPHAATNKPGSEETPCKVTQSHSEGGAQRRSSAKPQQGGRGRTETSAAVAMWFDGGRLGTAGSNSAGEPHPGDRTSPQQPHVGALLWRARLVPDTQRAATSAELRAQMNNPTLAGSTS